MRFRMHQKEMAEGMRAVRPACHSGGTAISATKCVLVEAKEDGTVEFSGNRLDAFASWTGRAEVLEPGRVLAPGREFAAAAKSLLAADVEVSARRGGGLRLAQGDNEFVFLGPPADEFPRWEESQLLGEAVAPKEDVGRALEIGLSAAPHNDTRKVLNGLCLTLRGDSLLVEATDGKRMIMLPLPLAQGSGEGRWVAPYWLAQWGAEALRGEGPARLRFFSPYMEMVAGPLTMRGTWISGNFPELKGFVPKKEAEWECRLDKDRLACAVRRCAVVGACVRLAFEGGVCTVQATASADKNGYCGSMSALFERGQTLNFNAELLLEVLGGMPSGEMAFRCDAAHRGKPVLLQSSSEPFAGTVRGLVQKSMPCS